MKILSSKNPLRLSETGIYLPLLAGVILSILLIGGFAIEVSHLYLTKQRIQRAFDAAMNNAVISRYESFLIAQTNAQIENSIQNITRIHLQNNLREMRVTLQGNPLTVRDVPCPSDFDPAQGVSFESVENIQSNEVLLAQCGEFFFLSGNLEVPTLILSFIPGIAPSQSISAAASAENQNASIILVLDVSQSMLSPASQQCTGTNCLNKITALREATDKFVNRLIPGDQLGIVTFSMWPREFLSLRTIGEGSRISCTPGIEENSIGCLRQAVRRLDIRPEASNLYIGLAGANQMLEDALAQNIEIHRNRFVIFLSDGEPFGYADFGIDWSFTERFLVNRRPSNPGGINVVDAYQEYIRTSCMNNAAQPLIRPYFDQAGVLHPVTSTVQQTHYAVINMADRLRREHRMKLFSIGFGFVEMNLNQNNGIVDIYQRDTLNSPVSFLNPVLMHRIANDRSAINFFYSQTANIGNSLPEYQALTSGVITGTEHPYGTRDANLYSYRFDVVVPPAQAGFDPAAAGGCVMSYQDIANDFQGRYLAARNERQLEETFNWITRRIRMRLRS